MTNNQSVMCSKVAQLAPMNKERVHQDMATLVMIFKNLSEGAEADFIHEGEMDTRAPFSRPSLMRAFLESFSCRSDADLCFKDAVILAEYFVINQLLNRKQSDLVKNYVKVRSTKHSSASALLPGHIKSSKNLRAAFGYTTIATSFVLLQWKDDVLSVISDVEFGRLPKKWPTAAESSCCCLDPHFLLPHLYLRLRSIAILRKNEVEGCMKV
jgi:hypothetical protein